MKRALIYTRTSTSAQQIGHEAQEAECRRWAESHGAQVVAVFSDTCSGATSATDRPGLMSALAAIRKGDLLLAFKRDRVGRDLATNLAISGLVAKAGAQLVTTDTGEREGPEAQLLTHLLDAIATYERAIIRLRTQASVDVRRKQNKPIGPAPTGQRIVEGALVTDPEEQAKIQSVQEWRAQGLSYRAILRLCAEQGITSRRGKISLSTIVRWCESR